MFRLKDLANFKLKKAKKPSATFHSVEVDSVREAGGSIIHWVPKENAVPVEVTLVDGEVVSGFGEPGIRTIEQGTFLQFERVGFARVYDVGDPVRVAFGHK